MAIYDINGTVLCDETPAVSHTDAECTQAFMSYMAEKCSVYGMTGTHFENPSGLTIESHSTPQDLLKLGLAAASNREAVDIWSTASRSFAIKGNNARTISVENNTIASYVDALSPYGYKYLGGKGGSLTISGYDRAMIALVDIEGIPIVFAFMARGKTSYNNRTLCAKEICDMVKAKINGQTPTQGSNLNTLISDGGGYAACAVPVDVGGYVNFLTPSEAIARQYSVSGSPTANRVPASTTKTMTMLCALDFVTDMYMPLTVKTSDITSGSGSTFYNGDTMSFHDAVRIMMMESSNTLATAIARTVGNLILNKS